VQATIGQATPSAALAGSSPTRQSFEDQPNKSLLPRAGSLDQHSTSVLELLAALTGLTSSFHNSLLSEMSFIFVQHNQIRSNLTHIWFRSKSGSAGPQ